MVFNNYTLSLTLLIIAFFIALTAVSVILSRIIYITKRKNIYNITDAHNLASNLIFRMPGISFFPIMLFVISICALIATSIHELENIQIYEPTLIRLPAFISGYLLIWGAGVKNDITGLSHKNKITALVLAALILIFGDIYINDFNGLFGIGSIPDWIGMLFTIILVMFIISTINLIDSTDGPSSGFSIIAFINLGILFFERNIFCYTLICTIFIGILIPFFYFNVFKTNKKIFMGNTGSLTIGYLLAFLGIRYAMNTDANYEQLTSPAMITLSVMFIPLFDALRVMMERMSKGKSPFHPDRRHIHHKLLDLGLSHRKTMVWLVISAEIFVILNTNLVKILNINVVFAMDMILWVGLIQALNFLKRKKDKNNYAIV